MTHERDGRPRLAVIGGGVAGIVAAHLLRHQCQVTLLEQGPYLGGHTHTIVIPSGPDAGTPVDTGFIVFNQAAYPHFVSFLEELGVASRPTEMSFSCYCQASGFLYAGNNLQGLFAQPGNAWSPRFYHFLWEIVRFCRLGQTDVERGEDLGSLDDYIRRHRFNPFMVDNYLRPMAAAIWSTPTAEVTAFPALAFLRFFKNHGLFALWNRPRWRTVVGGSHSYVQAFAKTFPGEIRLDAGVRRVLRDDQGIALRFADGREERYDQAVIACHADQALRLLGDPSAEERRLLGPWTYEENHTVLHRDEGVMPPRKAAWASWNFRRQQLGNHVQPAYVTYWMNLLQGLRCRNNYLVTLNRPDDYDEIRVVARMLYHHPCYSQASMATQDELPSLNGVNRTWFCGSYFGYGFHEDAVRSSYQMAAKLKKSLS